MESRIEQLIKADKKAELNFFSGQNFKELILQTALFIFISVIYIYFCAPAVISSVEFINGYPINGDSLSLASQADYRSTVITMTTPLWYILARIVRHIPFGDFAYRLNVMSALFGAVSVLFLFKIVSGFRHNRYPEERIREGGWFLTKIFPALAVSLIFAFSYPFWLLSGIGSPDTLQIMLFLLVIYFLLSAFRAKIFKYFYYCVIALALGVAVYPVIAVISPVIMLIVAFKTLQIKGKKHFYILLAIYTGGFLLHFYHPVMFFIQEKGDFPQYKNFFDATISVISKQFSFLRWLIGSKTLLWLPISVLPMLVFIRWRDTGTLKTASHILRISLMMLCLLLGIFIMLNGDRRFIDPVQIDLMMYNFANPFPFIMISLWLGYIIGYLFIISSGKKPVPSITDALKKNHDFTMPNLIAIVMLIVLFSSLAMANFWLNSAPVVDRYEFTDAYYPQVKEGGKADRVEPPLKFKLRMCGSSLREFYLHERTGRKILAKIREFKYETGSAPVKANAIITNSYSVASLLEYMRMSADIGYDYVVYIKLFREEEWYYNSMMKYAFKIDPGASWDLSKYSFTDAMFESIAHHNASIACVLSIDEQTKKNFEQQFKLRYGLWASLLIAETKPGMSLIELAKTDFKGEDIAWFGAKDPDSLKDLLVYFEYANKQERADDLIIFMLNLNPDDRLYIRTVHDRLNLYVKSGKIEEAQKFIKKAVKVNRNFEYFIYALDGMKYYTSIPKNIDKAIESFIQSMKIKQTYLVSDLLVVVLVEQKRYAEAYQYAGKAIDLLDERLGPQALSRAKDLLGWTAFLLWLEGDGEKMEEAFSNLKEAYELDNMSPSAMLHYGVVLYASDDESENKKGLDLINLAKEKSLPLAREADEIIREINAKRNP